MRNRAADGVNGLMADDKVEVGPVRPKGIIARCANLRARLPPAMLAANDIGLQRVVQPRPRPDAAFRRLNAHPVARADASLGGYRRMQLDLGVRRVSSQARQRPLLSFTKQGVLGAGENQRVTLGQLRS